MVSARSELKLRDHYDWVVLGDHPGALLSAALAARLGLAVLVLPLVPGMGTRISKSGQCVDPESNFLMGMGRSGAQPGLVSECLHRLGILHAESESIHEDDQAMPQVVTPRHRITLSKEKGNLQEELDRELGSEALAKLGVLDGLFTTQAEYERFWLELPARLTLAPGAAKPSANPLVLAELQKKLGRAAQGEAIRAWSSGKRPLSSFLLEERRPELEEVCAGFWYAVSSGVDTAGISKLSMAEMMHMLTLAFTGASFRGGLTAYRELLLRLARRHGAFIPPKAECRRIFVENGHVTGVQVAQRGEMITLTGAVLGCSFDRAMELMTGNGRPWVKQAQRVPKPVGWKFTVALTVGAEAVPPGMTRRVVWQERGAPPLEIECVDPEEYGLREADRRLVFLRTVMPYTLESLAIEFQSLTAARMLRQLTELMPFLEYHILKIFPDFRQTPGSAEIPVGESMAELYGFSSLEWVPENLRCYSGKGAGSRSGIEGLFVASGEAYPELGSLGGTVAAIESVAWLAHRSGLPGPLS